MNNFLLLLITWWAFPEASILLYVGFTVVSKYSEFSNYEQDAFRNSICLLSSTDIINEYLNLIRLLITAVNL